MADRLDEYDRVPFHRCGSKLGPSPAEAVPKGCGDAD